MKAKEIYNRHLKEATPNEWVGEKQMELIKYEATISALNELIDIINTLKETIEHH